MQTRTKVRQALSHLRLSQGRATRSAGGNFFMFLILALVGAFMAMPLIYAVVSAFKPLNEFYIYPPKFYVVNPTTDNFTDLLKLSTNMWVPLSRYFFNSLFVSVTSTLGHLVIAAMAAYILSRHRFPGRSAIKAVIIVAMMYNTRVIYIPQYIVMSRLGWINTYLSIIMPVLSMALGVFLLNQFMEMLPNEIIESARMDGAGEMRICFRIVVPTVRPAMITVAIFAFQQVWGNTGSGLIYSESLKVLPLLLNQISASGLVRAGVGAAASLIIIIPPIVLFIFGQSKILETMASSGIKG